MTITTNRSPQAGDREFFRRPATNTFEAILTMAAGAGLGALGLWRKRWFGAALAGAGGYLVYCAVQDFRRPYQGRVRVGITIAKEPQQVYDFVTHPQNWNRFLHVLQLENRGNGRLTVAIGKLAGIDFESRVEITDHRPGEYIAWASTPEYMLEHRGVIRFDKAPDHRGTELKVALEFKAPTGPIARALASFVGWDPEQLVRESLRHVKQLMEAGEIPTTVGQPVGDRGLKGAAMRVMLRERPSEDAIEQARLAGD
jgi:uncharacterized membrane protein